MSSNYRSSRVSSQRFNNITEDAESSSGSYLPIILITVFILAIIIGSIVYGSTYYKRRREHFTDGIKNYTLQYYCMKNCGHCKNFEDTWKSIEEATRTNQASVNYTTVKYDITDGGQGAAAGTRYNVSSTPTILIVNNSTGVSKMYEGARNKEAIIAFANNNSS